MKALVLNSQRPARATRALVTVAILAAGLASLATIGSAAAGKGDDNRAPKASFAGETQNQIGRAPDVRGDRPAKTANESCRGIHCRDHAGDHHQQH